MSDFWAKVLGTPPAQPQQAPAPTAPESLPWWQRPAVEIPAPTPAPQQQQLPPQNPAEPVAGNPNESLAKTQWAQQSGKCPNPTCGSGNYFAHPDNPTARPRCYDCGYPLSQSGSGVTLKGQNVGPVKEARQTAASRTNDFNPQAIFDRLG